MITKEQIKDMKRFWKAHREKSMEEINNEINKKMEDIEKWSNR